MAENDKLTFEPQPIIRDFLKVDRLHRQCIDKKVSSLGYNLHRNQHAILMFLSHYNGLASQKDIAAGFGISAAAVANSVKVLESEGYIVRVTDASDSRRNLVSLTETGREIIHKTHTRFEEIDQKMLRGLSENEMETLTECMYKISANLKEILEEECL